MAASYGGKDFVVLHLSGEVDVGIYPLEDGPSRASTDSDRPYACKVAYGGVSHLDWIRHACQYARAG